MTYPALLDRPAFSPAATPVRPMRAIMLGCGVVGGGVIERLPEGIELLGILTRTPRPEGVSGFKVFTDPDAVFALKPELVIEALPGGAEAEALVERAVREAAIWSPPTRMWPPVVPTSCKRPRRQVAPSPARPLSAVARRCWKP